MMLSYSVVVAAAPFGGAGDIKQEDMGGISGRAAGVSISIPRGSCKAVIRNRELNTES